LRDEDCLRCKVGILNLLQKEEGEGGGGKSGIENMKYDILLMERAIL